MMSKHLFFKAMREDLRHKTWMIALAILAAFVLLPVAWLLYRDNIGYGMETLTELQRTRFIARTVNFFANYVTVLGGIYTFVGAFIVGLFGFRYVFHKNMVDTWHSLPIKRDTLFGAIWLNGFLIWLVPLVSGLLLSIIMGGGFAFTIGGLAAVGTVFKEAGKTFLALLVVFMLVYHLILIAVMLSGNILNALVSMAVLGFGVIGIYGLCIGYLQSYMDTYYEASANPDLVGYASPFYAGIYLLMCRVGEGSWKLGTALVINLVIGILLGLGAWILYKKRASELAEQGIKNKYVIALLKVIVGVAAGMCGWMLFVMMTNDDTAVLWGSFGAILVTVIVFGVMDIIFHMDFKAFFAHKIQLVLTTAATLIICFGFCYDWIGYDEYLPEKNDIAEMSIYDSSFANRYFNSYGHGSEEDKVHPLDVVSIKDKELIYAFLERMAEGTSEYSSPYQYNNDHVQVKVTLENGKTYYRSYRVRVQDKDVFWPLITGEEYLAAAYLVETEVAQNCYYIRFDRESENKNIQVTTQEMKDTIASIIKAYNQDVLSNPDGILTCEGRLLTRIELETEYSVDGDTYLTAYQLDVYDSMKNTVEAVKAAGYEKWVSDEIMTKIKGIRLYLGYYPNANATPQELIVRARSNYGVYTADQTAEEVKRLLEEYENYEKSESYGEQTAVIETKQTAMAYPEFYIEPMLEITDEAEIEELIALANYSTPYRRNSVFQKKYTNFRVIAEDGEEFSMYIRKGELPEKYILRFGELDLEDFLQKE